MLVPFWRGHPEVAIASSGQSPACQAASTPTFLGERSLHGSGQIQVAVWVRTLAQC